MKILLQLNNPSGMGADRWIMEGYRAAFEDLGHECTWATERDDFESLFADTKPNLFLCSYTLEDRGGKIPEILKQGRLAGVKVCMHVGEDFRAHAPFLKSLQGAVDIFYTMYAPEVMDGVEAYVGKNIVRIPPAANKKLHFPVAPDTRFAADISFVGARLATKEMFFRKVLLPLTRKYRVRIYGPGWTVQDSCLRILSGLGRRFKFTAFVDYVNHKRLTLAPEDERLVYASSAICFNIHERYADGTSKNLTNEREFKIPACGGFQLSDAIVGIERYFRPGVEIAIAPMHKDWPELVAYYLTHPEERHAIQEAGTRRALAEHTYHNRVEHILTLYRTLA